MEKSAIDRYLQFEYLDRISDLCIFRDLSLEKAAVDFFLRQKIRFRTSFSDDHISICNQYRQPAFDVGVIRLDEGLER